MSFRHVEHSLLERVTHIDAFLKAERPINCTQICEEFGIKRKTVLRDINYMRERLARPIEFDPAANTYRYTRKVGPLPSMKVGEGEVFALLVARKALEQYRGTPFHHQLAVSFTKLSASLRENVSFAPTDDLQSVSFKNVGVGKSDLQIFTTLNRAVTDGFETTFDYRKPGSEEVERRHVRPYHLASRENLWYLVAFDVKRGELRTFALPRMSKVKLTEVRFTRPADFSAEAFFAKALGAFGGSREIRVVLRFHVRAAADRVREREWHQTQTLRDLPDGRVELSLTLGALEEIERWVLSWGADVEVLEPVELRERIRQVGIALQRRYASGSTPPPASTEGESGAGDATPKV